MLTENQLKNYWRKVDKKGEYECWEWRAALDKDGYGVQKLSNPRRMVKAHRIAAYLSGLNPSINSLSMSDLVLHTCDNPKCQNPKHHFVGTSKDNVLDMVAKGRGNPLLGSSHQNSKLTIKDVTEIRWLYMQKYLLQKQLAALYKVCPMTIHNIVRNKIWRHV